MRRFVHRALPGISLAVVLALAACAKKEQPAPAAAAEPTAAPAATAAPAVHVTDVQLGKSLGPDKKVAAPADIFAPKDTIFASVATDGAAPSATIHVKWTYENGQTVKEDSRTIAPTGPAQTEFSIQKPDGWPKGDYKVEVSIEGQPSQTKSFKVS